MESTTLVRLHENNTMHVPARLLDATWAARGGARRTARAAAQSTPYKVASKVATALVRCTV